MWLDATYECDEVELIRVRLVYASNLEPSLEALPQAFFRYAAAYRFDASGSSVTRRIASSKVC